MSLMMVVTALGWVGAIAGLVAYAMVSRGRWSADSLAFQCTNVLAAGTMLTVAAANGVWPSAASNIAAIAIGANALFTVFRAKRRAAESAPALTVVEGTTRDHREPAARPAVGHRAYAEAA
ncbi:hypothetical protein C8K30_103274 [Promicromonospora sp. AC04]|uniref:hypothetical protein n=1 Tax=Promicromonospora sp. AC04 TaxID=2135723 RepID=UPI000D44C0E0|nr:hypothetical protein [Promicromonospora sp. AC04]PUB28850.1 hypothetical protein C8K30_103274 [Promicromonospora sp. AC04]